MSAITNWQFSIDGLGTVQLYTSEFYYAGGLAIVGIGDGGANGFDIISLGNSEIALLISLNDQDGNNHPWYWNSHYGTENDYNNGGMMLWNDTDNGYESSSIGQEQTFKLVNLGNGYVAMQATGGAFPGQYLGAMSGGWYPQQWYLGSGSFLAVGNQAPIKVSGDQFPILLITNSGYELDLSGRDLGAISLQGANMKSCNLTGANLSAITSIQGADFTSATMRNANLKRQNLIGATWTKADFTKTDLTGIASAAGATMPGAIFDGANLTGRNFALAHLAGASFIGATLDDTNFTGADLTGANFAGAILGRTKFGGATLLGTHFDGVDLSTATFSDSPEFTRSATNRTTFIGSTVPFRVLASNWSYLDLTNATITGIPKSIANLVADGALLPDGLNLEGVDLTGASFVGTRMYTIQLQNANLQGANLSKALLKGAKLVSANLTLANFDSAYLIAEQSASAVGGLPDVDKLSAAVATNAFMFNTILDGAHCDGVDFSGAIFVTAASISSSQNASAVGASMNFARFDGGAVVLAVFDGAQLSAASFAGEAIMVGASFQDNGGVPTQLTPSSDPTHTPASVYQADIRGTNFTGANMDGLDMRDATYSTSGGTFEKIFAGYNGAKVPVAFKYGPTLLGNTTSGTVCPDGNSGPCSLSASVK